MPLKTDLQNKHIQCITQNTQIKLTPVGDEETSSPLHIVSTGTTTMMPVQTCGFTLPELHDYDTIDARLTAPSVAQRPRFAEPLSASASETARAHSPLSFGATTVVPSTPGANGSLITMTMKNNQLIVETEERNVSGERAHSVCSRSDRRERTT